MRHLIPLIVFLAVVLVASFLYIRLMKRKQRNEAAERNESKVGAKEHSKLQRVKPILQKINERLGDKYMVKLNHKGELVGYDSDYLFNAIDEDRNGTLSFSELQKALDLTSTQLQVFIKKMNEAGGATSHEVSRKVFADSFLDVITKVANFDPTPEDAIALFEEIVRDNNVLDPNVISLDLLKYSSLSLFLSDKDILKMTRLLQLNQEDEEALLSPASAEFGGAGIRPSIFTTSSALGESTEFEVTTSSSGDKKLMQSPISTTESDDMGNSKQSLVVKTTCTFESTDVRGRRRSSMLLTRRKEATITKEDFVARYPSIIQAMVVNDEEQLEKFDLHFENLSLHVHVNIEDRPVVNNVTGRVRSGAMTALLGKRLVSNVQNFSTYAFSLILFHLISGGSGAGKTSLLNALCGRAYYGTVSGKVTINGQAANIDEFTDVMGFVPQDDIVFAELTVRENLIYAGKFKLPKGTPLDYIQDLADEVIADLGLTRVADSMVGDVTRRGVSGGEKKRVNIGLELMAKPSVLFLDEPTSGLGKSECVCMKIVARCVLIFDFTF